MASDKADGTGPNGIKGPVPVMAMDSPNGFDPQDNKLVTIGALQITFSCFLPLGLGPPVS